MCEQIRQERSKFYFDKYNAKYITRDSMRQYFTNLIALLWPPENLIFLVIIEHKLFATAKRGEKLNSANTYYYF